MLPEFTNTEQLPALTHIYDVQNYAINKIAERLKNMSERMDELGIDSNEKLIASNIYRMERILAISVYSRDFETELATATGRTVDEIKQIFANTAKGIHNSERDLFKHANKPFVTYEQNRQLQQLVKAQVDQTQGTMSNLTRTVGFTTADGRFLPPRDMFIKTLTLGEQKLLYGVADQNTVIKDAVRELVDSGLKQVEYPNSKPWSLVASVSANIKTGLSNIAGEVAWQNMIDLDVKLVDTSFHMGSRETHKVWQGRRFALNMTATEARDLVREIREKDAGVRAMRRAERSK
jgi:hypothetical protein